MAIWAASHAGRHGRPSITLRCRATAVAERRLLTLCSANTTAARPCVGLSPPAFMSPLLTGLAEVTDRAMRQYPHGTNHCVGLLFVWESSSPCRCSLNLHPQEQKQKMHHMQKKKRTVQFKKSFSFLVMLHNIPHEVLQNYENTKNGNKWLCFYTLMNAEA